MKFNAFGHNISITRNNESLTSSDRRKVTQAIVTLKEYMKEKAEFDNRVIENERWYRGLYWDLINGDSTKNSKTKEPEPVTSFLFSTVVQKHADCMDNFPKPTTLPREESDIETSETLTEVLPVILKLNKFKKAYSLASYDKIKHGVGIYGTFWDSDKADGLGDVTVKAINLLNLYWEMGVDDIEDSDNVFMLSLLSEKKLADDFGINEKAKRVVEPKRYAHAKGDITKMTVVVDWYYKKVNSEGKKVLHLCKFIDSNNIIFMSEQEPEYAETGVEPPKEMQNVAAPTEMGNLDGNDAAPDLDNITDITTEEQAVNHDYIEEGLYDHCQFPFDLDILFPDKSSMVGFGYIDILKNPQIYIDKLDQIISSNALKAGKVRHFVKREGFANPDAVLDYDQEIIETNGNPNDVVKQFQLNTLHPYIMQHRQSKINELKEIASNNEFNRGEGGKGVTAAAAIQMLQEEGNKTSRDMISYTYEVLENVFSKIIHLLGQFYDENRTFRITKPNGEGIEFNNRKLNYDFIKFNNAGLKMQETPPPAGVSPEVFGIKYRKPIFDIEVVAEKKSPYTQAAYNAMSMEMFGAGFFNPDRALEAQAAMGLMQFEGKEEIKKTIMENNSVHEAVKMMQQNMERMNQENVKLKAIVQEFTGKNLGVNAQQLKKEMSING